MFNIKNVIRKKNKHFLINILIMIKVRFNLSRGINYMKWKIEYPNGDKVYINPESHNLMMYNVLLKNRPKTAEKIFNGGHKVVCAWIYCQTLNIVDIDNEKKISYDIHKKISYNPRKIPNWVHGVDIIDDNRFDVIITNGRSLYIN